MADTDSTNEPQEIEQSKEEKDLNALLSKVRATPKFTRWMSLFLDKSNKQTFGNRTQSALIAYGLNKDDPSEYNSARHIGWENYTKVNNFAAEYLEQQGMSPAKILDLLAAKAVQTTNAKYLQLILEITGMYNPKPNTLIQSNTNVTVSNIEPEKLNDWNAKFKAFLKDQIDK